MAAEQVSLSPLSYLCRGRMSSSGGASICIPIMLVLLPLHGHGYDKLDRKGGGSADRTGTGQHAESCKVDNNRVEVALLAHYKCNSY